MYDRWSLRETWLQSVSSSSISRLRFAEQGPRSLLICTHCSLLKCGSQLSRKSEQLHHPTGRAGAVCRNLEMTYVYELHGSINKSNWQIANVYVGTSETNTPDSSVYTNFGIKVVLMTSVNVRVRRSYSWRANSSLTSQEIDWTLWYLKIRCLIQNSQALVPILRQIIQPHALPFHFF